MSGSKIVSNDNVKEQLIRLLDDEVLSLDFISAMAGDRVLSDAEQTAVKELKRRRGKHLYADVMFTLTHQHYAPDTAEELWKNLLDHKYHLSTSLNRNIGVSVAALDYLANIENHIQAPTVISQSKMAMIAEVAIKDGLTGLFDAATVMNRLENEIIRYRRYQTPVSVIMMDVDNFKQINDRHGHQMGDRVLASVARIVLEVTRDLDFSARYGGEEFLAVLPQTECDDAMIIAERIRESVEETFIKSISMTLSLGVATCPDDANNAIELVGKADAALYDAKRNGKNRVMLAS